MTKAPDSAKPEADRPADEITLEAVQAGARCLLRFADSVNVNMDLEQASELAQEVYLAMRPALPYERP